MISMILTKFRIIVRVDGKKKTRHVRARDRAHATEQAATIASIGRAAPGEVLQVVQMGHT